MNRWSSWFFVIIALTALAVAAASTAAAPNATAWNVVSNVTVGPGSPIIVDGLLYIADGDLRAIDPRSGRTVQRYSAKNGTELEGRPLIKPETVYVGHGKEGVIAFDRDSGRQLWRYDILPPGQQFSPAALVNDTLYLDGYDALIALDKTDGTVRWNRTYPSLITEFSDGLNTPVVLENGIYNSNSSNVFKLDRHTGDILWRTRVGGELSSVVVAHDTVFAAGSLSLYALNATTGEKRWTTEVETLDTGVRGPDQNLGTPTYWKESIYVMGKWFRIFGVDAETGTIEWTSNVTYGRIPTVAYGRLYAFDRQANLAVLDPHNGTPMRRISFPSRRTWNPIVANGTLYVGGDNPDQIYAVELNHTAWSMDSRVLHGVEGYHDSYSQFGPLAPGDSRLQSVDWGSVQSSTAADGVAEANETNHSRRDDRAVPGFGFLAALTALAALLVARRGPPARRA